ncbi:hypothetical protein BH23ACT2_BH23ACT2_06490 [soil metagenome]
MGPVRSAELRGAVSLFTDLGTGQPTEHALRTCIVAMRLADGLGVGDDVRLDVFYGSLIRFLGCTADAHEVAATAGGDDLGFLAGMAPTTMGSPRQEIAGMVRVVARRERLPRRLRLLARAMTTRAPRNVCWGPIARSRRGWLTRWVCRQA